MLKLIPVSSLISFRILLSGVGCCPGPFMNTEKVTGAVSSPAAAGLAFPPVAVSLVPVLLVLLLDPQPVSASVSANTPAAAAAAERFAVLCMLLCLPFLANRLCC
ncbi:hypothetical protein D3C73_666460 [compost metagenome]